MNKNSEDCAPVRIPPPLYFLVCMGLGLLLEHLFPDNPINLPLVPRLIGGGIILLISGYFALSAFIVLAKNKTTFNHSKPTNTIVKEGPFRFSRNPMYLSLLLLIIGFAVLLSSVWLFIVTPLLYFTILFLAIKPEENYLSLKFGKEYSAYKASVRRWI